MNELYRAKDNDGPRVPPIVPLPKLPSLDDHISFKRSTALIIVILIGIMMFGIMFYKDYQYAQVDASTNLKVYCEPPLVNAWRPTVENNMQAAHTYTEQISTKDTQYCFKVDDVGTLFGSSMQPTFFEGNTILLKNYTINMTLKTGDIIRFFRFNEDYPNCTSLEGFIANNSLGGSWVRNDMAVIHRVNAVYQDNVLAQGDNLYEQEQLQKCQITDVAVGIIFT